MMSHIFSPVHLLLLALAFFAFDTNAGVGLARAELVVNRAKYRSSLALRPVQSRFLKNQLSRTTDVLLRRLSASKKGCKVSICFAVESTSGIPFRTFEVQKQVQSLVSAIVSADPSSSFASVQYGLTTTAVTPSTPRYFEFFSKVSRSKRKMGNKINLGAGLAYCGFQTIKDRSKKGVVIIIGSGRHNTGFPPAFVARVVKRRSTLLHLSTNGNARLFTQSVGVSPRDVILTRNQYDLNTAIKKIIPAVCN